MSFIVQFILAACGDNVPFHTEASDHATLQEELAQHIIEETAAVHAYTQHWSGSGAAAADPPPKVWQHANTQL